MMTLSLPQPALSKPLDALRRAFGRLRVRCGMDHDTPEDARNRRAFVHEMLERSPDAFSSDLDVQNMMCMYPGRF